MTPAEREQIISMSPAGRISHYLKKKIAGEITSAQYDDILAVVLRLPYTQIVSQGSEIRGYSGEQRGESLVYSTGSRDANEQRREAIPYSDRHADTPTVEQPDSAPFPKPSYGTSDGHSTAKDNASQKQRLLTLLSDYEWKTTPQIQVAVYGANHLGIARVAARVNDLKQDGYDIESRKVTQSIWEYRLVEKGMKWITENIASG